MTLTQLFTAIANAIRAKTGSSDSIYAEDFPDEIADITTGHLDNTEYAEANDDLDDILEGTTPVTIFPPDWSQLGYTNTPQSILDDFNHSKEIYDTWDSSTTTMYQLFKNDIELVYMPKVNSTNVTNMREVFSGCSNLIYIPLLDTSNITNTRGAFRILWEIKNIASNRYFKCD